MQLRATQIDGASKGNPGPGGAGVLILKPGQQEVERAYGIGPNGTNNEGELVAIAMALETIDREDLNQENKTVYVLTDSTYCIGTLTNGWHSTTNSGLTHYIRRLIRRAPFNTCIEWVPGHADVAGNEQADYLANLGVTKTSNHNYIDINIIKGEHIENLYALYNT
jgi:ribonuclease HI